MNPFIIRGYAGRNYFCDREQETERLMHAIENRRNLTLVSLRKMGKTGLIMHAFEQLEHAGYDKVYIDIFDTENLEGFTNKLAGGMLSLPRTFGERLSDYFNSFRHVRPVISADPLTGLPSVSFRFATEEEARQTLAELFKLLEERSKNKPVVLAIDEFQQITKYPEKNIEALIRTGTQQLHDVSIIFSGSNKSLLGQIFSNPSRPFYQSTEMMFLEAIGRSAYEAFIGRIFRDNQIVIGMEETCKILDWTNSHTYYVQYCCNKLFERRSDKIKTEDVLAVFNQILVEYEPFFFEFRNLLTSHQWQLLKALAKENGAKNITSSGFIKKHGLTSASSIKRGIVSLLDKELIHRHKEQYFIQDVFFSRWLELQD